MKARMKTKLTEPLFLPYQAKWLNDPAPVKLWEKSRRIGATYAQSYEDVRDIITGRVQQVWFSSADESAAKEYINYCLLWVEIFSAAANADETVLNEKKPVSALELHFAGRRKITALTSNPKAFRSKGGKVVLDEFAHHDDASALWKAARPVITWGAPLRILSTHNGKLSLFYRFVESIKAQRLDWSLHSTNIFQAAEQGLIDRIMKRRADIKEKEEWLNDLRRCCLDEIVWQEEYCCIPCDISTAFITLDMLEACVDRGLNVTTDSSIIMNDNPRTELYLGVDIGRTHDATALYLIENSGDIFISRMITLLKQEPFAGQIQKISELLRSRAVQKCYIDATGMGLAIAEELQNKFGRSRVEGIIFTSQKKEELAYLVKKHIEQKTILFPNDRELLHDLHSIRRISNPSGAVSYRSDHSMTEGNGDRFWALALALSAAKNAPAPINIVSSKMTRQRFGKRK
jgi:phage FluMu gp28-like protein